ncbi:TetR/AcrR family transcriptional regulator [Dermatobacter hominis]|uniref:TetR/AcrR family transcriptional regulator n=1 Tax=Dermatobacter hominis TaxID=2884263 RepID=UPI001D0F7114|nr:TetR/AcrR family transcriptional regulator [Dermatobacter hominis]UDY34838.1 TetR/AcrR family transcriptional regulator [Dermatobacter hominis]
MSDPVGDDEALGGDAVIDLRAAPGRDPDTRERLVRAAAEVFREKGYTGSRVQDIARRAGFTSGALYTHFDSRAELLAEAIAVENSRMFRLLSEGLGRWRAVTSSEVAESLASFVALETSPTDQLMLDGFAICTREEEARDRIGESLRGLLDRLDESIRTMSVVPGSPMDDDSGGVAYLMVAFMSGVAALRAAGLSDRAPNDVGEVLAGFLRQLGAQDQGLVEGAGTAGARGRAAPEVGPGRPALPDGPV